MPRILFVIDATSFGGAEQYVLDIVRGLPRERFHCHVALPDLPPFSAMIEILRREDIAVHPGRIAWTEPKHVRVRESLRLFREARGDLIHFNLPWPSFCAAPGFVARVLRRPYVTTTHLLRPGATVGWRYLPRIRAMYHRSRLNLAVSHATANLCAETYGLDENLFTVIPNGIAGLPAPDPEGLKRLRREIQLRTHDRVLLCLGRLDEQKGQTCLLRAVARLLPELPGIKLLIAGSGPDEALLTALAASLGIAGRVYFLGQRRDLAELFELTELLVMPSLFEGLPFAMLEAMAAGKPVLASDVGGVSEALRDGETGVLVPPGDVDALVQALAKLLAEPETLRRMGLRGRDEVAQRFTRELMIDDTARALEQVGSAIV